MTLAGFDAFVVPVAPEDRVGRSLDGEGVYLAKPFGKGFFDLALACAASHPAKSGSPPSS